MEKHRRFFTWIQFLAVMVMLAGFYVFLSSREFKLPFETKVTKASSSKADKKAASDTEVKISLPAVTLEDWELILVNRSNMVDELNPELGIVGPIYVDSRIVEATAQFLAAAQAIDPNVHLISGYRSVVDQGVIYNGYVEQEMAAGLTYEQAVKTVQTYSQPAGASEHQTGLAIDMSTVDSLNQMDPLIAKQIQEIAPDYGFVLRFPENTAELTGIGYEDWHYRYVGVDSAKYMTENNLTLEEYIDEIRRATQ